MSAPVDVLLRLDVLIATLPLLVAEANKSGGNLTSDRTIAELREARAAVSELIALVGHVEEGPSAGCGCKPLCRCNEPSSVVIWAEDMRECARVALARVGSQP